MSEYGYRSVCYDRYQFSPARRLLRWQGFCYVARASRKDPPAPRRYYRHLEVFEMSGVVAIAGLPDDAPEIHREMLARHLTRLWRMLFVDGARPVDCQKVGAR